MRADGPKPKLVITVPLAVDQWQTLKRAANAEGMALSAYVRAAALRTAIKFERKEEQ